MEDLRDWASTGCVEITLSGKHMSHTGATSTNGLDVTKGGARYNTSGSFNIGLSDVVDSLMAIKTLVYDTKAVEFKRLKKAIDTNFENDPGLHAMAHPDDYPNLLVRISGYNAYFVNLNHDMQLELIERAEYNL